MNSEKRTLTILTILLALSLSIVSYYGAFDPTTYQRDSESMAVQGIGQDIVDLFLVVPLLLITIYFIHRDKKWAWLIHPGAVLYVLYSFFIYSFGVYFNNLFLWYCATLGLAFFAIILDLKQLFIMDVKSWFEAKLPIKSIAAFFTIIAIMFYVIWMKDIIPAIINDSVPKAVSDYNLLVNPVHVLDLAFVLPGLIITSVLLLRRQKSAYILSPLLIVFIILMAMALLGMVIMLAIKGINDDTSVAGVFAVLAVIGLVLLTIILRRLKN